MNAIRVNDVEIGAAKIAEEMQYHPASSAAEAQRAAAEALVVRELLRQEARAQGFGDGDEATEDLLEAVFVHAGEGQAIGLQAQLGVP